MIKELIEKNAGNWDNILILFILLFVVAGTIYFASILLLRKYSKRSDNKLETNTHRKFKIPMLVFLFSAVLSILISEIDPALEWSKGLNHFINLIIIFGITWLLIKIIKLGKAMVLKQYDYDEKDNLKARKVYTQFTLIERFMIAIVVIIAIAVALLTFEKIRAIGVSLFASAGVAGIILGFAAQKLLGNVLAGFQIAVSQPIRLDDVVIVEGEWGWIEEITLTYVVVRIWDKRRLVVPTTYFVEKPFQNWTRESADILGTVFIYADYTVPFDKLREELSSILKSDKNWDGKVNNLQVTNATDKTVEIRALMSSHDSPSAWDLRVRVREKLISFLQQNYPDSLPRSRIVLEKDQATVQSKPDQI